MIYIGNVLIEEDILREEFCCDLKKCRGACCTFEGEFGAPLADSEVPVIRDCIAASSVYLSDQSKEIIKRAGFYEGQPGELTTNCINHRDCVFVFYEKGNKIALCALEKAYLDGKTNFKKPLSCHLFPLRVSSYGNKLLYYQRITECESGRNLGRNNNIKLVDSLKEPLTRAYGESWYQMLLDYIQVGAHAIESAEDHR